MCLAAMKYCLLSSHLSLCLPFLSSSSPRFMGIVDFVSVSLSRQKSPPCLLNISPVSDGIPNRTPFSVNKWPWMPMSQPGKGRKCRESAAHRGLTSCQAPCDFSAYLKLSIPESFCTSRELERQQPQKALSLGHQFQILMSTCHLTEHNTCSSPCACWQSFLEEKSRWEII